MVRKFIYGPGIDEPIRMITSSDSYYYHYDRQGTIIALSDSGGYIVENYQYDAFGQCVVHTEPGPDELWMTADDETDSVSTKGNPYIFTGRRLDPETGLYYYRFRHYNPGDGRFMQVDPIRYYGGLNLYTYCGNNPLNWLDPWGLCEQTPWYYDPWVASPMGVIGGVAGHIHDIPGRIVEAVYGADFTADQLEQLSRGWYTGMRHGEEIALNEYTFGLTDWLDLTSASERVSEYGAAGVWSRRFAGISRDAAIAAAVVHSSVVRIGGPGPEPTHIGFDLPGGRNIVHYGRHVRHGRHIGIGWKKPFVSRWHIPIE